MEERRGWLAENAETHLGVPDPAHTLAITPGEKAARLGGKAAAFLADLRFLRGRGLPGYVLPGPGLPVPGDRPGQPAPTDPGQPERWDASYEDARALGQFGLDLFGELRDAVFPPTLKSLDQASGNLVGGVTGPGGGMPQLMVQGGPAINDRAAPFAGGGTVAGDEPRQAEAPEGGESPAQTSGTHNGQRPALLEEPPPRLQLRYRSDVPTKDDTESKPKRGVYFFDTEVLPNIDRADATLGLLEFPLFFMPREDSFVVKDAATAYRYTGGAPSVERAYRSGGDVYGIEFPLDGFAPRLPTAADTTLRHYLEGGHTALQLRHGNAYLLNPTREFVVPGGGPMPRGSFLFRLGPNSSRIRMRGW